MSGLIHQFITVQANRIPDAAALFHRETRFSYAEIQAQIESTSTGLIALGLEPAERVAIYLPKIPETVFGLFGAAMAGGVFVPINPLLNELV